MSQENVPFHDITLRPSHMEEDVMGLFALVRPSWTKEDLVTEVYSEGFMNRMMCFHLASDPEKRDALVVRVHGALRNTLPLTCGDRELMAMQLAQAAGCFQDLVAIFRNGVAYMFAPGRTLNAEDLINPDMIRRITKKLVALHSVDIASIPLINSEGEPAQFEVDGAAQQARRSQLVQQKILEKLEDPQEDVRYQKNRVPKETLTTELDSMRTSLESLGLEMCLIHGDFHIKNIIYNASNGDVSFLDYELSEMRYEAQDLVNVFAMRPVLEIIGMFKPEDPTISEDVRALWLRCYLEAKYEHQGKDPRTMPEIEFQLADVQHKILEVYQCLIMVSMVHVFVGIGHFDNIDSVGNLPKFISAWNERKQELPGLIENYLKLKEEINEARLT